jgi:hypothetical protein
MEPPDHPHLKTGFHIRKAEGQTMTLETYGNRRFSDR